MVFLAILLKVLYIQFWQYGFLNQKAYESWDRQLPQVAERGLILNRNQTVLVANELKPTIYVMPGQLGSVDRLVEELASLSGLPKETIHKEVTRKSYLNELRKTAEALTKEQLYDLQTKGYEGLYITIDYKRSYPYDALLAPVVGFVGADSQGLAGLEYNYDSVLTGKNGTLELHHSYTNST
ncbi:hypothetical protein LG275_04685 [Chryseomicrobium palamuruense]